MPRVFVVLALLAGACAGNPCGDGHPSSAGEASVCAYPGVTRADVVIVGGFDCPPGYDILLVSDDGVMCLSAWVDPDALPEDACRRIDCSALSMHVPVLPPGCESLDDAHCLSPWPSDRLRESGAVVLPDQDADLFARADGFSAATPIAIAFAGAIDGAGLSGEADLEASVTDASPTLVLDTTTGARVPHVAELDGWPGHDAGRSLLWIRPLALTPGHRYVVAIRRLARTDGADVRPGAYFRALRDGIRSDAPELEARRGGFDRDVRAPLTTAGVDVSRLLLAWSFTVASEASSRRDLDAIRAATRGALAGRPPECATVRTSTEPDGFTRVTLAIASPRVAATADPRARIPRDDAGLPVVGALEPILVEVAVAPSARARASGGESSRALLLLHAPGGSADQAVSRGPWRELAEAHPSSLLAVDLLGVTGTEESARDADLRDPTRALAAIATEAERTAQAAADLVALEHALPACAAVPALVVDGTPLLDLADLHAVALEATSLGAPALVAGLASIDGLALVGPTASFATWARRSGSARPLDDALAVAWPDAVDRGLAIAAASSLWDPFEPWAWRTETRARRALALTLTGSTSAPPFLGRLAARASDLPLLLPSDVVAAGHPARSGSVSSAWIAVDVGGTTWSGSAPPGIDLRLDEEAPRVPRLRALLDAFLAPGASVTAP